MKGWYGNKQKHSLASKGIKSKQYKAFGEEYDYTNKPYDQEIFERAKEHFGITDDIQKAGFILPNGEMLDFSHKTEDYKDNHAVIKKIEISPREFIEMGAVRVTMSLSNQYFYFSFYNPLTISQKRTLSRVIKEHQPIIYIDIAQDFVWHEDLGLHISPPNSLEFNMGTYAGTVFRKIEEAMV